MVGTHLLPPNLLKLFAPRPPLPYLKPTGRDPDLPLKSLSAQRAPQPIRLADTLALIRAERDERERKAIEEGRRPDQAKADKAAVDEPAKSADGDVEMADQAEEKVAPAEVKPKQEPGEDGAPPAEEGEEKEEGEEPDVKAAAGDETPKDAAASAPKGKDAKKSDAALLDGEGEALVLTEEEKVQARRRERQRRREEATSKQYDPSADEEICGDPYKTLFVGRLPLDVTEKELLREFEIYGPLERVRLVTDQKTGKSKGYAFLVYERERDMKAAYKDADGLKMHGKRLLIDVERGRTVKGWKPRRLGGGLGGRIKKLKGGIPAPDPSAFGLGPGGPPMGGFGGPPGFGGHFAARGGFRGGFGGGGGGRGGFAPRGGAGFGGGRGGFGGGGRGGYGGGGGGYGGGGGPPPGAGGPGGFGGPPGGMGGPPGRGGFQGGGIGYQGMQGGRGGPPPSGGAAPGFQGVVGSDSGYGGRGPAGGGMAGGFGGEKRGYESGPGGGGAGGYGGGYEEKRMRY